MAIEIPVPLGAVTLVSAIQTGKDILRLLITFVVFGMLIVIYYNMNVCIAVTAVRPDSVQRRMRSPSLHDSEHYQLLTVTISMASTKCSYALWDQLILPFVFFLFASFVYIILSIYIRIYI